MPNSVNLFFFFSLMKTSQKENLFLNKNSAAQIY